jgi:hypothetical protein
MADGLNPLTISHTARTISCKAIGRARKINFPEIEKGSPSNMVNNIILAQSKSPGSLKQTVKRRRLICGIFIGYTAIAIILYLVWGLMSGEWVIPLGPLDKLAEVILISLLRRGLQGS